MENIKHYFAGINSKDGFIDRFDNINTSKDTYTYILKGGPGCGKSTLMKTVGQYFASKNIKVEYYHCSSDLNSIDAINIPAYKTSIVDGTAPHIVESKMIGINSTIINLGEYISPEVKKHYHQIFEQIAQKELNFKLCYAYIKSASAIYEAMEQSQNLSTNTTTILYNLIKQLKTERDMSYIEKHLFISCIEKNGIFNLISQNTYDKITTLTCNIAESHYILNSLHTYLQDNDISHIVFYEVLSPSKIEALYLYATNEIIISKPKQKADKVLNSIIKQAGKYLDNAKIAHKSIENIYINYVNFNKITQLTEHLILQIEKNE